MKTVGITIIICLVLVLAAGYFGLPILIEKQTTDLKAEILNLNQRIQTIEEQSKVAPLLPDADVQKVIKTVNALYFDMKSFKDTFDKKISATDENISKQKMHSDEAFKKQNDAFENLKSGMQAQREKSRVDASITNIRDHILKVKLDLIAKNIGVAKDELGRISEKFEQIKPMMNDAQKKSIEDIQSMVKKARAEIDNDIPAAANHIELLWHDIGNLIQKADS